MPAHFTAATGINPLQAGVQIVSTVIGPDDLGLTGDVLPQILTLAEAKEKFQRDYINEVLALNNGNRTKTARDLGVDPRTVFRHLEKEGDAPEEDVS